MKRLGYLLRIAFHDWMWEGGHQPDRLRAAARHLPLYFSDPYWMSNEEIARVMREGTPVELTRGPRLTVQEPWRVVSDQHTWASGKAYTIEYAPKEQSA